MSPDELGHLIKKPSSGGTASKIFFEDPATGSYRRKYDGYALEAGLY